MQQAETFLNGEGWQIKLGMSNGILKGLNKYGRAIHYLQSGGKETLIQSQMNNDIILQNLEENITKGDNE